MEKVLAVNNINSVCRLCLVEEDDVLRNILLCDKLREKIFECTSLEIRQMDGLPPNICSTCYQEVDKMYKFRSQCISSDAVLRTHFLTNLSPSVKMESRSTTPFLDHQGAPTRLEENSPATLRVKMQLLSPSASFQNVPKMNKRRSKKLKSEAEIKGCFDIHTLDQNVIGRSCACTSPHSHNIECTSASRMSTRHGLLSNRKQRSSSKARFVCQECNKVFKHRYSLSRHHLSHKGNPFYCKLCNKYYLGRQSFRRHEKTHSGEKPYKCEICEKSYVSGSSYSAHLRKHTGERPYKCPECKESFYLLSSFDRHAAKHKGVRKYICEICSASFWVADDLRAHVNRIH